MSVEINVGSALELYFLGLVNDFRAEEENLPPLILEQHLNAAADAHGEWLIAEDAWSHTGENGSSWTDRIEAAGFVLDGPWTTGENLGVGAETNGISETQLIDAIFQSLINSPDHRANILHAEHVYTGISIQFGAMSTAYGDDDLRDTLLITQTFGATDAAVMMDPGDPSFNDDRTINGDDLANILVGGTGDDDIFGLRGDDSLYGGEGADVIKGGIGNDTLDGGDGNDTLTGGSGEDILYGGSGINKLVGQSGSDMLYGGDERDILNGGGDNDSLFGGGGNDRLKGGFNNDVLYGGDGPDKLYANNGADSLFGGDGDDLLNAGGDADWLEGGAGTDRIKGGSGADTFVFVEGADEDRLVDFAVGEDLLLIHSSYWDTGETVEQLLDDHAEVDGDRVVIDFGNGQKIVLQGLSTLDGLDGSIDMI